MAAYIIKSEIKITRQEGDDSEIVIIVPDILSLNSSTAKFQVKSQCGLIFQRASGDGITINGQTISIILVPANTKGKSGKYRWELEITTGTGKIITIGRGDFVIEKELIS
jgi:hypothetical protein